MRAIVAVDSDWMIGKNNDLLFRISEDLKQFKKLTMNKCVIMGRNTLESLPGGKPLPGRTNIVLSTNKDYKVDGAIVINDMPSLYETIYKFRSDDVFVIGGSSIYRQLIWNCSSILVTYVDKSFNGDVPFPKLDNSINWEWVYKSDFKYDEKNDCNYQFIEYRNKFIYKPVSYYR